ncbi:MAG: glycoside hydrolase family 97 protein [Lentimicrobium sp.]|jgi:alpha-glucosidase|nr:glycoside hydrolase family 97 protein [Lentimicrobium sp.]
MTTQLKNITIALASMLVMATAGCSSSPQLQVSSPDGNIVVSIENKKGEIFYSVNKAGVSILNASPLGFVLGDNDVFFNNFEITGSSRDSSNTEWEQVWGESRVVKDNHKELVVNLREKSGKQRELNVIFRVFDDGFGFRYEFPKQENLGEFVIMEEKTGFNFPEDLKAWWIPAYNEVYYESLTRNTPISEMDTVATPLTIEAGNGNYYAIHEANLTDYAKMNLYPKGKTTLACDLSPWSNGVKVYSSTPMLTPWRTMIIADDINQLATSNIMLNLNEPSKIDDVSWIKPGRYVGIWWEIHLGKYTWSSGEKHGATTENTKAYIDFAAANGFSGVLVEGWNEGWDGDWTQNGATLDFTKAYPDFNIKEVTDYARSKGVELIGHHETAGMASNYEKQLDSAFKFYQDLGVHVVKTGYVNPLLDNKELHDGQFAVRHYRKVVETAAKYQIMIDNHEPVMPTGLQRTWPNFMTHEGVRGQEYDAWSTDGGNPPDHTTIIPFVRGLAGPMDFTQGTFNFENPVHPGTRVQTTVAKQLALYVVIYSPLAMASDGPENYEGVKAFDFIKSVPTSWEKTIVPEAKIGEYAVYARKQREGENWYMGAITNEDERTLTVSLSFLDKDATYSARIYSDAPDADWKSNPTAFEYTEKEVDASQSLEINMAKGGGFAVEFVKK